MPLYKHTITGEVREMSAEWLDQLIAAANPKADGWTEYTPPVVPVAPPRILSVPRRAFFRACNNHGITRDMLRAACMQIQDARAREAALIDLDESVNFERDNPLVVQFAAAFGFDTDEKLDALFAESDEENRK